MSICPECEKRSDCGGLVRLLPRLHEKFDPPTSQAL